MTKQSLLLGVAFGASTLFAAPVMAQVEDEVIVTATKRATTLQDTPVAVTVVAADIIEKAQILDIKDLQSITPSFRVSQLQNAANTTLIIRGFGNGGNNLGIEPSVGLYVDGVYRSRAGAQIADLPNLERVEVLAGPQSILFGKNASAGVVSIVTAKPEYQSSGYVEAGVGNFNLYQARGYLTGGISDNLAVSIGGGFQQRDGYFDNVASGDENSVNDLNRWNIRAQALWEPNDNASFRVIYDKSSLLENCCGTTVAIDGPFAAGQPNVRNIILALGGDQPVSTDPFAFEVFTNRETENDIDDSGISLEAEFDFGAFTLTSLSSYRENEVGFSSDSDFNSLDLLNDVFQEVEIETFTQEVRIASTGADNRFDWLIGGFYFDETLEQESGIVYGADLRNYIDILAGGPATLGGIEQILGFTPGTFFGAGQGTDELFVQDNENWSVFGTVDFHVTDKLTITGGLNYTEDDKDVSAQSVITDVFSGLTLEGADGIAVATTSGLIDNFGAFSQSCINPATGAPFAALPFSPANIGAVSASPACFINPADLSQTVPGSVAFAGFQQQVAAGAQAAIAAATAGQITSPFAGLFPLQFQPDFLNFPNSVEDGRTRDDELTYTVRGSYEVNDNLNVYASYATGFKASSFNLTRDTRPFFSDAAALNAAGLLGNGQNPNTGRGFGTRFAGPEETEVFELGLKARFEKFAINVALYDQTIDGFQSTIFQGTGFVLNNAGQQSTQGIDFDASYKPFESLTLTAAGVIQDPVFDDFTGASVIVGGAVDLADGVADGVGDLSGEQPAGIPEISLSFSATYSHDFGNGIKGFIRGDYQFEDEVQVVDNIEGVDREVSQINASLGLSLGDHVDLRIWARNLNDDQYFTSAFPGVLQGSTVNSYPNQPRTFGAAARYKF